MYNFNKIIAMLELQNKNKNRLTNLVKRFIYGGDDGN